MIMVVDPHTKECWEIWRAKIGSIKRLFCCGGGGDDDNDAAPKN
jgi:hypothetical protein